MKCFVNFIHNDKQTGILFFSERSLSNLCTSPVTAFPQNETQKNAHTNCLLFFFNPRVSRILRHYNKLF